MSTSTMNGKLNLLEEMAQVIAAPQTKAIVRRRRGAAPAAPRVRRVSVAGKSVAEPAPCLWRVALEATRDSLAERLLTWTLFAVAATGLGWLAYTLLQFFFAWSHLVTWIRAAMV